MCDFARLTQRMFESLADIEKGRFVYIIALKASEGKGVEIEDVIIDEIFSPRLALEHHCKSNGLAIEDRLCLPVILPPSLKAEDVRGFRSIRTQKSMWIEYAGAS